MYPAKGARCALGPDAPIPGAESFSWNDCSDVVMCQIRTWSSISSLMKGRVLTSATRSIT